MPRAGLAPAAVVTAGAALADEVGLANLTMGLLAERIGVRPPSLYEHITSLGALRRGIAVQADRDLGLALTRAVAGRSGPVAIHAFADTFRHWVLNHPGRYAATIHTPSPGVESLQVLYAILTAFGPHARASTIDAARTLRSSLHGFATLESAGGFGLPRDIDRSYLHLVDALIAGLHPRKGTP